MQTMALYICGRGVEQLESARIVIGPTKSVNHFHVEISWDYLRQCREEYKLLTFYEIEKNEHAPEYSVDLLP